MVMTTPIARKQAGSGKTDQLQGTTGTPRWARKESSAAKADPIGPSESDIRDAGNSRRSCVEAGEKATEPSAKTD
jgi:hypothetical protein